MEIKIIALLARIFWICKTIHAKLRVIADTTHYNKYVINARMNVWLAINNHQIAQVAMPLESLNTYKYKMQLTFLLVSLLVMINTMLIPIIFVSNVIKIIFFILTLLVFLECT